jgi:hypothetical protein
MQERTILAFHVDTLHSLMTAVGAAVDMVRSHDHQPVSVSFEVTDFGGDYTWLKLVECNTNIRTYYQVRLEQSDG